MMNNLVLVIFTGHEFFITIAGNFNHFGQLLNVKGNNILAALIAKKLAI